MDTYVISESDRLRTLSDRWNELAKESGQQGLHMSFNWFWASCLVFHQNDSLHVVIVHDEAGAVIGIAPLVITSGQYLGVKIRKVGFPDNPQTPSNGFILARGREEESVNAIVDCLENSKRWDLVDLRKLEADSLAGQLLKTILSRRKEAFGVKENIESPYVLTCGDWQGFWQSKSKRFRKSMRNKLNRIQKSGDINFIRVPIINSSAPELIEMKNVSSNSWKKEIGEDLLNHEANWKFYQQICDLFGDGESLCLWILKKKETCIAFEFHLNCNGVAYPIRADYDESYRDISPGSVLEHHIIKALFEDDGVNEYNTCGHTYNYLMNWTDLTRQHENIEFFNSSAKMTSLYWMEYKLLPGMRRMKMNDIYHMTRDWVRQ